MNENKTYLLSDDRRIEPPPKIGWRKQKSERKLELERWRFSYISCVEYLWSESVCFAMWFAMLIIGAFSLHFGIVSVKGLEWMHDWLKVVIAVAVLFASIFAVWGIFNACIHIVALFQRPYPLPKLNFKQTYKFGK